MKKHSFLCLMLLSFGTPALSLATPAQVLLIRHAEKPDPEGIHLSPEGYLHAAKLVPYFMKNPAVTRYGTPAAIYAMFPSNGDPSLRPIETVTPLAAALGLKLHTDYKRKHIEELVNEIMHTPAYDGKMVLICWEHKMIASIAELFGVNPKPVEWEKYVFNQVWEIDFKNGAVSDFKEFTQQLQ